MFLLPLDDRCENDESSARVWARRPRGPYSHDKPGAGAKPRIISSRLVHLAWWTAVQLRMAWLTDGGIDEQHLEQRVVNDEVETEDNLKR